MAFEGVMSMHNLFELETIYNNLLKESLKLELLHDHICYNGLNDDGGLFLLSECSGFISQQVKTLSTLMNCVSLGQDMNSDE